MTLDDTFLHAVAGADKLCHHFHISLQSGCDETLARMNRKYTTEQFSRIVHGLREAFCDVAITTDVMVGFPGETEEEFAASLAFVEQTAFADLHVFQYSPRPGTPAAVMEAQVPPEVKHARSEKMIAAGHRSRDAFLHRFLGRDMTVLFEQEHAHKGGWYEGKTENYITVVCEADHDLSGRFAVVRLGRIADGVVYGTLIQEEAI